MKRMIALICVLVCLSMLCVPALAADNMIPVLVQVPDDWDTVYLYAWVGDSWAVAWPGTPMVETGDGWYCAYIPSDKDHLVVNIGGNVRQTGDLEIEAGVPVWVTVAGDNSAKVSYDPQNSIIPDYEDTIVEAPSTPQKPETVAYYTVHVDVPDGWGSAYVWAFNDNNINASDAWPGLKLAKDSNGYYTGKVPTWATNMVIAEKDGGAQTVDIKGVKAKEQWIVLGDQDPNQNNHHTATVQYSAPENITPVEPVFPDVEDITVYAIVPESWTDVRIWAWDDTLGNASGDLWPGTVTMTLGDDGWYSAQVPGWVTGIVLNANDGVDKTCDLIVEAGRNVWIIAVGDPNAAEVDYEGPVVADPEPSEPAPTQPVETQPTQEDVTDPSIVPPDSTKDQPKGDYTVLIVVICCAVAIGIATAVFFILKKKRA